MLKLSNTKNKYNHTKESIGRGKYKHICELTIEEWNNSDSIEQIAGQVGYDPNAYGMYKEIAIRCGDIFLVTWESFKSCD